jgi:hypothetical protein
MMKTRLGAQAAKALESAGWFPGRRIYDLVATWAAQLDRAGGFQMFPAAAQALNEFGGLRITQRGPGLECALESFDLVPTAALGEEDRFAEHARIIGSELYPLGEYASGCYFIAIDEHGRVFLLMDDLQYIAETLPIALDSLLTGRRSRAVTTRRDLEAAGRT